HWITCGGEDDRSRRDRRLHRQHSWSVGYDHRHLATNQLKRDHRHSIVLPLRPAILNGHVLAFDIAAFVQALTECGNHRHVASRRCAVEKCDDRHRRLLRARRERPRDRHAEQRYELAPLHSITSSAMASTPGGTVRPSVLAVFKLITNSNLVGWMTGKSAGFS